jgi:hypothetical protein
MVFEKAPPIKNSSDLQLALRDVYETTYGIHNHMHETEEHALSLVAVREAEDSASGGLLYERIRQYHEREIGKYFKLNVVEFLDLPTDLVTYFLEQAGKFQTIGANTADSVEAQVRKMTGED